MQELVINNPIAGGMKDVNTGSEETPMYLMVWDNYAEIYQQSLNVSTIPPEWCSLATTWCDEGLVSEDFCEYLPSLCYEFYNLIPVWKIHTDPAVIWVNNRYYMAVEVRRLIFGCPEGEDCIYEDEGLMLPEDPEIENIVWQVDVRFDLFESPDGLNWFKSREDLLKTQILPDFERAPDLVNVEGTNYLFFSVDGKGIYAATSLDMKSWTLVKELPIIPDRSIVEWNYNITSPSVLYEDGLFKIYYTGKNSAMDISAIGLVEIPLSLNPEEALFYDDLATGGIYVQSDPVLPPGEEDSWDRIIESATVVKTETGDYRMWYSGSTSFNQWGSFYSLGTADSNDGKTFLPSPINPISSAPMEITSCGGLYVPDIGDAMTGDRLSPDAILVNGEPRLYIRYGSERFYSLPQDIFMQSNPDLGSIAMFNQALGGISAMEP